MYIHMYLFNETFQSEKRNGSVYCPRIHCTFVIVFTQLLLYGAEVINTHYRSYSRDRAIRTVIDQQTTAGSCIIISNCICISIIVIGIVAAITGCIITDRMFIAGFIVAAAAAVAVIVVKVCFTRTAMVGTKVRQKSLFERIC